MELPSEHIERMQKCIDQLEGPVASELDAALSGIRSYLAKQTLKTQRLASAQAEAIVHSAEIIGELEETKERLHSANEVAEAATRAKSLFLANMSHEIRTPLNGILGFTDLIIQQGDLLSEAERIDYLTNIQVSGKHLLSLINAILDLSKIESEQLELEYLEFSPHTLLSEVVSLMRVSSEKERLRLDYQWTGPLPETIRTDPTRLRQMLVNLMGNAIKFTDQGCVRIDARLVQSENDDYQLRVDVTDSGIGIPEDKLEAIFSPFSQADNSITRKFGGTGLGLTISRRLARAMGGELTAESRVGSGSTFSVTIDVGNLTETTLLPEPQGNDAVEQTGSETPVSAARELPAARILLVEDSEINQKLIVAILARAGVTTLDIAENGEIGVRLATESNYDLILLDMQMPVMDGYTAAAQLRSLGIETPVIALTAHAMKGDEQKCTDAGCDDYLSKPIDADDLVNKVVAWIPTARQPDSTADSSCEAVPSGERITSTLPIEEAIFLEIVQDFGDLLEGHLRDLHVAAETQDIEQVARLAHDLVGTAGGAGFADFTDPSRHLETLAREGRCDDVAEALEALVGLAARVEVPAREIATAI